MCRQGSVRVGVIDSGWDRGRRDPRVVAGVGLVGEQDELSLHQSADDNDRNGHGTKCIDLLLQVAPDVQVVPIRVFGGRTETSVPVVIAALKWAIEHEVRLISMSLSTMIEGALEPLYAMCEMARRRGVIVVASASNAKALRDYPAMFECVVGVRATVLPDRFAVRYYRDRAVECGANARHWVCGKEGRMVMAQGTSFATPVVTGRIAQALQDCPGLDLDGARRQLAVRWGGGILD